MVVIGAMLAAHSGPTVRVQSSTLGSTFFSIPVSLLMGSLSLQTIVAALSFI